MVEEPSAYTVHFKNALAAHERSHWNEARLHLDAALELRDDFYPAYLYLSKVNLAQGDCLTALVSAQTGRALASRAGDGEFLTLFDRVLAALPATAFEESEMGDGEGDGASDANPVFDDDMPISSLGAAARRAAIEKVYGVTDKGDVIEQWNRDDFDAEVWEQIFSQNEHAPH